MHEEKFPPVLQIRPLIPTGRLPHLGYIVRVSGEGYFNSRQKDALTAKLRELLKGQGGITVKGRDELAVTAIPGDSINGRFALLEALQQILNPEAPFSALGILLSPSLNVTNYVFGLQLLGTHEEAVLARIQTMLGGLDGVQNVTRMPDYSHVFQLEVGRDWRRAESELLLELQDLGFGATLQVSSGR